MQSSCESQSTKKLESKEWCKSYCGLQRRGTDSIESISEKAHKTSNFAKKINIEISTRRDYIVVNLVDTGLGFNENKIKELTKPYFTTKKKGTGLGLSIVNKIINDHNGSIKFLNHKDGAKIQLILPIEKK